MSQPLPSHRHGRSLQRTWLVAAVAALVGITGQPASATAATGGPSAQVNAAVTSAVTANGTAAFMVYLREKANLSTAATLPDSRARAQKVYSELTGTAERTQRPIRTILDEHKAKYRTYWIANVIRVDGDKATLDELAASSAVERIEPTKVYPLILPTVGTDEAGTTAVEWGIDNIKAPQVWSEYGVRGEGIVVANIDSGVQYDHPALVGQYRGNLGGGNFDHDYNWFDPAGICPDPAPCDNNDHGTHTMGTMVGGDGGANQIGVAPGAKWIAAKGCESNNCSDASLLAAGQWVLAPTDLNGENPRPDLHADIVNNSWGGSGGDVWYQQTVDSWVAAGVFPTFSNGNEGPGCGTAGSPGDYPQSYGVGAYNISNTIASFSSRGASSVNGEIKPNISAPGVNVRSSIPDGSYAAFNGTSMAAPHVSGAVALIWAAAPALKGDIAATRTLLDTTATDVDSTSCGGTVADNNNFGEGRLNVYQAVTAAPRGPTGTVSGVVTDSATSGPLAGVTVSSGSRSATTDAAGAYALTLPAGAQDVTAAKFGYHGQTVTVTVVEAATVSRNFALTSAPAVTVSGKVTDGSGHGWPLYARIDVPGRPGGPVFTDPFTGTYSFTVPGNATYQLTTGAKYPGYQSVVTPVALTGADRTVNIAVPVETACIAPGYSIGYGTPLLSETFDSAATPAGWTVTNRTTSGGWAFTDLGARGNLTGGTGGFAIIDSDKFGSSRTQDTDLVTPSLNLSAATTPYLRFNSDYRGFSNSIADVDVSVDGGTTWSTVWHQTSTSLRGPRAELIPLTGVAGAANAQIRFRYRGTWAWWWELDNVEVVNRSCNAVLGGLVAGLTTDTNTAAPLNGVTVSSVDVAADKAVSAATPDDPTLGDGFYWLFSTATDAHPFTATKSPYQALTKTVTVAADGVKRTDYALKAGRLTVTPTSVQAFQPYGSVRKATVTVTNTGSAPATVDLLERNGDFDLLGHVGATLIRNKIGTKVSRAMTGVTGDRPATAAPNAAGAWAPIADYPVEIFDNAAANGDGKVYSVGGGSGSGSENKAFVYDPAANVWAALPNLPVGRAKPQAAFLNGKLYVFGGWAAGGTPVATVAVFDPAVGTWSTLPGATNPKPRAAAGIGTAGGKVYLVGGCADGSCATSADTVVFDPASGIFTSGAAYPQSVAWISCGGIGDKVYCGGGSGDADFATGFSYDPAANAWSPIADLPLDLWGSAGTAAGGLLVLAGGVTDGSTVVTNQTVAYDPAADTWLTLPNAQFAVYRGAAACGAYKIGGSPTSFVGSTESEFLADLGNCGAASDIPWLSTTPASFTLLPGKSKAVTVTLTATEAAGVLQPGKFTAELGLKSDTPYAVPAVSVEMNVSPPPSWGKIQGRVLGQTCSGGQVGVPAIVRANLLDIPGVGYTLKAGSDGMFAYWVPRGNYEIIVAKDNWIPEALRLKIQAGIVLTVDFTLDPITPCTPRLGGI